MIPALARLRRRLLCALGDHEDIVATEAGILRARCLHCGRVTAGWHQGTPGYRRTQEGQVERLHNPRLERCECAACDDRRTEEAEAKRRARRQDRRKVAQLRRRA